MTYYTFRFEQVLTADEDYVDMDFYDEQPGKELRYWKMFFDRDLNVFGGYLFMSENEEECVEEYRNALEEEIDDMWNVIPAEIKLKYAMIRK